MAGSRKSTIKIALSLLMLILISGMSFWSFRDTAAYQPWQPDETTTAHYEPETEPVTEPEPEPEPCILEQLEGRKIIALTFDDGPNPYITTAILDFLEQQQVLATFFVTGRNTNRWPHIPARATQFGHQVANHSYNHRNFTRISSEQRQQELRQTDEAIYQATGIPSTVTRPPYGSFNRAAQADFTNPLLLWSVDPWDWNTECADYVAQHVLERAQDGDIILLHDLYQHTYEATRIIVPALLERGFVFVTIDQMLELRGGAEPGEVVRHRHPPAPEPEPTAPEQEEPAPEPETPVAQ